MIPFRKHHMLQILNLLTDAFLPLDMEMSNYFRAHRAIGSKDRLEISQAVYTIVRWQGALDSQIRAPITWEKRLEAFEELDIESITEDKSLPLHIRCSFPKVLFDLIAAAYGEEKAFQICLTLNERAPLTLRVNLLKTTRAELKKAVDLPLRDDPFPTALIVEGRANLFQLEEFRQGHFECQDAGSQAMAALVDAKPGDHVLDMCSGSGGKSLAIAPLLQGKGQLYLYDIRPSALAQAKKRLKRAGITNVQIVKNLAALHGRMDHILTDVPCTGTGTLRRNPDLKWKFTLDNLSSCVKTQREIVAKAWPLLKAGGVLTYITCSILPEENSAQVKYFLDTLPLELTSPATQLLPLSGGHDGFFGATFRKT